MADGYPDGQRVVNWDGPVLLNTNQAFPAAGKTYGPFDVARYAYLGGLMAALGSPMVVQVEWFADQGLQILLGQRNFSLDPGVSDSAHIRLPNLGPWVTVAVKAPGQVGCQWLATLLGTNRVHPLEFIPPIPQLLAQTNQAIGAGATVVTELFEYYSGPARIWFGAGAALMAVQPQYLDQNLNWQIFDNYGVAASQNDTRDIVIPTGAVRISVTNTGGAALTYSLSLTPSPTGST